MDTPLVQWIRQRIEADGPVPFERFMDWALYHPRRGYYTSGRVRVGHDEGDFTTSPHLSRLFARCLARLVEAADRALGAPDPLVVVEGGPGEGRLARDLLDTWAERAPGLYGRLLYRLDETSPALERRQGELLAAHGSRVLRGFPPKPFQGVYLSNELVDAFPVHRMVRRGGELREIHVSWIDGAFVEVEAPPSRPELAAYLEEEGIDLPEGCQAEVNLRALQWMAEVGRRLARGYAVTVDYGDEGARLYGPHRPEGTCVAYRGHTLSTDLLATPGDQDLTAHVNFSALRREGARWGLGEARLLTQRDFLFALGLSREVEALETQGLGEIERLEARRALAPLLLPGPGMGESFKALVQAKGVSLEALPLDPLGGLSP